MATVMNWQHIAETMKMRLRLLKGTGASNKERAVWAYICEDFADAFPEIDRTEFLTACGYTVQTTAKRP